MKRACAFVLGALLCAPLFAQFKLPKLPQVVKDAVGVARDVKDTVSTPDFERERAIGQGIAATLLGAARVLDDSALQGYVSRVGTWVALQGERPDIPWRFAVLDTPNVNAFAVPGGYVFVTRGLLDRLGSEAELAGALAHEIAHVDLKHHLKALQKEAGFKLTGKVAPLVIGRKVDTGGMNAEQLGEIARAVKGLYARGLDKADEHAADRAGALLAARAGYDPYGLVQVLQTLDGLDASSSQVALLMKTHPRPGDRVQQLERDLGAQLDALPAGATLAERYAAAVPGR